MSIVIKPGFVISNTLAYPISNIAKVEEIGGVCEITFDCGKTLKLKGHLHDIVDELTKNDAK